MTTHRWPRRCKSKLPRDWGVKYWEQLNEGGEVRTHRHTGESYISSFKSVDQLLKDCGAFSVYEVFDHHQTPPAPIHRWPRRAVRPGTGIKYLEQVNPDSRLIIFPNRGEPFRSAYLTMDELLSDANAKAVETFDHHDKYPRYLEERIDRGEFKRRKYTSADHAVWADGAAPDNNLCRTIGSAPSGGAYATLDAAIASGKFIETDANGVALDGSDAPTVALPLTQSLQQVEELKRRITELETELYRKDQLADAFRKDIADRDDRIRAAMQQKIDQLSSQLTTCANAALQDTAYSHARQAELTNKNTPDWSPAFDCIMRRTAECIRLRSDLKIIGSGVGTSLFNIRSDCERVFYAIGGNSPIVPKFIMPHETYGSAVMRLAQQYVMVRNELETLRNNESRSKSAADYATLQFDRLRYALNDIVKFARKKPIETDLDVVQRVFGERDALDQTIQKMRDALK